MSITITLGAVLGPVVLTALLFTLYLAYCALNVARKNGKLAATPAPVRVVCWAIFIVALVLDVLFNITVGTIAFLELPDLRRLTFTMRCKKWMHVMSWRGRLARWVCDGWLNPFEEGHC